MQELPWPFAGKFVAAHAGQAWQPFKTKRESKRFKMLFLVPKIGHFFKKE